MLPIGEVWRAVLETPLINFMVLLSVLAFGSYGAAILAFTVLTRVVTFPLTLRTLKSARRLQELQPDLEAIQKKHSDPKRRSEEQMKLYRRKTLACADAGLAAVMHGSAVECEWKTQGVNREELMKDYERHLERVHGVQLADAPARDVRRARKAIASGINPIGCIGPQLIQMPIFFALFIVIRTTLSQRPEAVLKLSNRLYDVDLLQGALPLNTNFLYMDLSSNGNFVLVGVIFVSMWLTQRISSSRSASRAGSQQAQMNQMMQWMLPALFGWFALVVPAGLGLYWAASTIIGLLLQWVFVGPGDFTWGSLLPGPARVRLGMPAQAPPRGGSGPGGSGATRRSGADRGGSGGTADSPDGAEPGDDTEQTEEADDGRRGKRTDGRRRRRSGARQARGQSRTRGRRGDPGG